MLLGLPDVYQASVAIIEERLERLGERRTATEANCVDAELVGHDRVDLTRRPERAIREQVHDASASDGSSLPRRRNFEATVLDTFPAVSFAL